MLDKYLTKVSTDVPMKPNRNKDLSCNMVENIDFSKNA